MLFRINAQSEAYEEALAARGLPYVLRGAARFFDRGEVREAVTRLRGAARGGTTVGESLEDAVRGVLGGMGWTPEAPAARGQTRDRWESLQALVDQAAEQAAAGVTDLGAFVDDLDRRAAEQHAPVAGGVTLATMHAAKGLEWDAVFVVGVCEGTLPITYADTPTAIEEERRLLYVGITRARRSLAVSWARARNPGGRATRKPSRFLDPLLPDVRPASSRTAPAAARSSAAASAASRWPPRRRRSAAAAPTARRPTTRSCSSSCARGGLDRPRRRACRRTSCSPTPRCSSIAEHKPRSAEALLRINGIGRAKLERYGEAVLGLVG